MRPFEDFGPCLWWFFVPQGTDCNAIHCFSKILGLIKLNQPLVYSAVECLTVGYSLAPSTALLSYTKSFSSGDLLISRLLDLFQNLY